MTKSMSFMAPQAIMKSNKYIRGQSINDCLFDIKAKPNLVFISIDIEVKSKISCFENRVFPQTITKPM